MPDTESPPSPDPTQKRVCKAGLFLDSPTTFRRVIEDCKVPCEVITPHLLAAPFFRGSYVALIVPTGFANRTYSILLPVLRARKERIESFVEQGGRLLVFGAADTRPDAYDWLPFHVEYLHAYHERSITLPQDWGWSALVEGYDCGCMPCDGSFPRHDGEITGVDSRGETVLVAGRVGKGLVIVTSVHEYPSRAFLKAFACGEREIPL